MGGSAWGVICDDIGLITTLKGNLEPTRDQADQCPASKLYIWLYHNQPTLTTDWYLN